MSNFETVNLHDDAQELSVSKQFEPYSAVEIVVSDETTIAAAGNSDNGRTLVINNPWGTQEQADAILAAIRGFQYQPYTASNAELNPAAEIGDAVKIGSTYSGIYKISRAYGSMMAADIEAPYDEEIDHEYPFETKATRDITRKFSAIESELRVASDEISAKVSKTSPVGQTSFSWNLSNSSWEVKSNNSTIFKVTSSGAEVTGKIVAKEGEIADFTIRETGINTNGTAMGNLNPGVYVGSKGIRINSSYGGYFVAYASGDVEANNLRLKGTLYFVDDKNNVKGSLSSSTVASLLDSVNVNNSTWTGTSTAWSNATNNKSNKYPSYFEATQLACSYLIVGGDDPTIRWSNAGASLKLVPKSSATFVLGL